MNEDTDTELIELRSGLEPDAPRRVHIKRGISGIEVPVQRGDAGFGRITYRPTGLQTVDGVPIWTPQAWAKH